MKRINICALLLAVILIPDVGFSQACPGSLNTTVGGIARVANYPSTAMVFVGDGCTYSYVGGSNAPTACHKQQFGTVHRFIALWPSSGARVAGGSMAGCGFMCGYSTTGMMNSCFVRASDGLPVELMEFNINE